MTSHNQEEINTNLKIFIAEIIKQDRPDSHLITVLHKAQELNGYLSREIMDLVSQEMNIPTSTIWGVATFYHYFKLNPVGKYNISVCMGTACYVKGGSEVLTAVKEELGIEIGQTTEDLLFSLHEARCIGACGLAPVAMINDKIYGELTPKKIIDIINNLKKEDESKQIP
ncbi:MAG: NAD(P)H-dependent oxidoreductase subunit E [Endomicrobiaceae bacterium]|jgi:NADH:ubiquinone oxidoreductase subunit E|nr:NAD(P)H-dependent oxidoreductase subunit E [Endomicrobiaceae bacterium]MDD3053659.1 NAD(P)H-dependent oxidoreductase subunit E [Endomicrobiaceae bacterium]MDD3923342.1 NAD(P)H-dependent oxidoreductase subunit E [Endomicrobiaceae bacterium]